MPRRRELKCLASGIASRCVSRNNDIEGYWALGVLYRLAQEMEVDCLRVDIMADNGLPGPLAQFRRNFKSYYGNRDYYLSHFIAGFIVEFKFDSYSRADPRGNMAQVTCHIHIVDDMGRLRTATASACCRPHDPDREHRSNR